MTTDFSTPLLDNDGKLRIRRFAIATISSAIVIAAGVAVAMYAADPDGGWGVAVGIGARVGFWMCPLAGAVVGNGFHEIMKDKEQAEATAAGFTNVTLLHYGMYISLCLHDDSPVLLILKQVCTLAMFSAIGVFLMGI